ncbi:MAG: putative nicotinamide N-methyase [Cellvibrionaceae bacterium]|jgi:predicted nicotinamide N-methyase
MDDSSYNSACTDLNNTTRKDKAEQFQRDVFGITVLKNSHADIRRIKREAGIAAIHGNKFWNSTSLMIDYLSMFPPQKNWRILEVGCGWGISGMYCAKNFEAKVTALDADDSVFTYLQHHAQLNGVSITTLKCRYETVTAAMLSKFDMVIGSDICFWDEMAGPLFNLTSRANKAGIKRVVMTDPGRPPFRIMADRCMEKFSGTYEIVYDNWSAPHPYNTSGLVIDISQ